MKKFVFILALLVSLFSIAAGNEIPKFERFVDHEDFVLNINVDSVKLIKGPGYPLISIDTQLILTKPLKLAAHEKPVKTYISTVAADCKNDQLYMLKNDAYGEDGSFLATDQEKAVLKNPKSLGSPVTNMLILICNVSANLNKTKDPTKFI